MPESSHVSGFDPMVQFVYEDDLARAVVAALDGSARGVFHVAGDGVVPWRRALDIAGAKSFPVSGRLTRMAVRLTHAFPEYMVSFFTHPCIITDAAFRSTFGWRPQVPLVDAIQRTAPPR